MGLEGIRLIACDLDGTLLHPGEREPRSEAFELIDELHRRGIVFMPASGRQYASLRYLFAPVADELAYVCENGALVMSEGHAVVKRSMERSLAMDIANAVVAFPHADVMASGTEWTDFIGFDSGKGSALADYGCALGISPNEMMAFGDNENDHDMLNVVGHPYLMEDCNPSMRGVNDRVRYVRAVEEELRRLLAE